MGRLRRFFRNVVRLGGTPHGIAGGFTLGLALSLIPLPFAGMLVALALAPLLRLNVPATYLGTAVVNPFTGAAFYFAELWVGMTALGRDPPSWRALRGLDADGWLSLFGDLLVPFAVGAVVIIGAAAAFCYPALFYTTRGVQRRRAEKKKAEAEEEGTASPGDASP